LLLASGLADVTLLGDASACSARVATR